MHGLAVRSQYFIFLLISSHMRVPLRPIKIHVAGSWGHLTVGGI